MRILIILFLAVWFSQGYTNKPNDNQQDTCRMLKGTMHGKNFVVSDTVYYLCDTLNLNTGVNK